MSINRTPAFEFHHYIDPEIALAEPLGDWTRAGMPAVERGMGSRRWDRMSNELATVLTQQNASPIGGTIGKPTIMGDTNMADAAEANGKACEVSGRTTCVTFMAACQQLERNMTGKRLRSKMSESANAPGGWHSRIERTMRRLA